MLESRNCCEAESLNAWSASWKISQIQVCQIQRRGLLASQMQSNPRLRLLALQLQHSVQALLPAAENVSAALHTIEELSRKYEAREALVLAGTSRPAVCATQPTAYYPASIVQELLFLQV